MKIIVIEPSLEKSINWYGAKSWKSSVGYDKISINKSDLDINYSNLKAKKKKWKNLDRK